MKALLAPLALTLVLPLAACSDDDNGPAPFNSGVKQDSADKNKPVSQLDEEEKVQLCRNYDAHVNVNLGYEVIARAACLPQAILLGGSREGCQRRLDDCMKDLPPPAQLTISLNDQHTCVENLNRCNASLVELEGCVNINLDWVYRLVDTISCGNYSEAEEREIRTNMASACADTSPGCGDFVQNPLL